jgi:regulatory protein
MGDCDRQNLKKDALVESAVDRALRYLSYRPRSESEVRVRLSRYGYNDHIVACALDRLRGSGLIDDASFAAFWRENRASFSPRSSRLVAQELRQKGVSSEIIAETMETLDNEAEAYRAGYKKAHSMDRTDYYGFRRKLGAFLLRRGFDYEVIRLVVERLWEEQK